MGHTTGARWKALTLASVGRHTVIFSQTGLERTCRNEHVCVYAFSQVVGRVMLLHLIELLTRGYLSDPLITRILNTSRVHILPSMNPDGFEASTRDCMYSDGR